MCPMYRDRTITSGSTNASSCSSSYSSPIVILARVLPCSRRYVTIARVSTPVMAGYIVVRFLLSLCVLSIASIDGSEYQKERNATYNALSRAPFRETLHSGPVRVIYCDVSHDHTHGLDILCRYHGQYRFKTKCQSHKGWREE